MELDQEFIDGLSVNSTAIVDRIAGELKVRPAQVKAVVDLLAEGCTVPFISRYRKERTGELDEVQVRDVSHLSVSYVNLETRRVEVVKAIHAQGKLDATLYRNIMKCATLVEIEDIYAPFKKKKKTRGMLAMEKGLEPLAEILVSKDAATVEAEAAKFVREDAEKPELSVASVAEAIQGACDIVAERLSQDPDNRSAVKAFYLKDGHLVVKGVGDEAKKEKSVYQMYWDFKEPLSQVKPHRVLAVNRGEREGELAVNLEVDEDVAVTLLSNRVSPANKYHAEAVDDSVRRLLSPAVLREIRSDATDEADGHGIDVFGTNLRNLLMSPPIKGTRVLGIDPGIRTGTKCAAMDETGKFLGYFVINQEFKPEEAKKAIARAVKEHAIQLIAVGNGTASHEVQKVVSETISENALDVQYTVVDEDGASVYSASDVAREEFPELDLTIRGAISIGRRLQDPLAELVKIDPKSIGVGLYQHDVNQKRLSDSVDEVVGSVVNRVGVNLNTASHSLLKYVSGINGGVAKKIVKFRDENGKITSRSQLLNIPGLGDKTYEQCAGFLKIPESADPLDNTWVHPENYGLAKELLPLVKSGGKPSREDRETLKAKYGVGDATIDDIVTELGKPNRDPREDFPKPILQKGVLNFEDLHEGMTVTGKVKNVVDFGAFVDLGIKESALIHVSELADRFVSDPMDVLKVGDVKEFRIISLDPVRKRIGLSLRSEGARRQGQGGGRGAGPERREDAERTPEARPDGARRVVVARRGERPDAGSTARPAATPGGQGPRPRDERRPEPRRDQGRKPEREDDGTTYNPFAELLKNRK
ncbi:MAG TPA: Tex family protein [Spirochaetales bacterium]|nr:Tex family protein [Spirochaetales bacterium]